MLRIFTRSEYKGDTGMLPIQEVERLILSAFKDLEYVGDAYLVSSIEGSEPASVASAFEGKDDWTDIAPDFLDSAGLNSALSFFSDVAFRFYIGAYMLADLRGVLRRVTPAWYLTHGLVPPDADERINVRRYGARTWRDHALYRFSLFLPLERNAIASYLTVVSERDDNDIVKQALREYWNCGHNHMRP